MSDDRKNLKVQPSTFVVLKMAKRPYETWDDFLRRLVQEHRSLQEYIDREETDE